jgi:chorismate synthase
MSAPNTFGSHFRVTTFGESHGTALGAVIEGCPAGVAWNEALLAGELGRRRPGSSPLVSPRSEADEPELLSGVFRGKTIGTPISVIVRNRDARPADYEAIARAPRPGHADDVWIEKFGHVDPRGGGRSSGRETLSRVIGGAVAKMVLSELHPNLRILGFASAIGPHTMHSDDYRSLFKSQATYPSDQFTARFASRAQSNLVEELLLHAKTAGLSYGGVAEIAVTGMPAGLGQPVFRKLKAELASACLGIGASTSFELGDAPGAVEAEGSEFHSRDSDPYGGIRGGISTGNPMRIRVGFKPTASVLGVARGGRHDPCIVPRAVPVLEAMVALVLADQALLRRLDRV